MADEAHELIERTYQWNRRTRRLSSEFQNGGGNIPSGTFYQLTAFRIEVLAAQNTMLLASQTAFLKAQEKAIFDLKAVLACDRVHTSALERPGDRS